MKRKTIYSELLEDIKVLAKNVLKEEEEQDTADTEPKEVLITDLLSAMVNKFSPKVNSSKSINVDATFRKVNLTNIKTKKGDMVSFDLDLEALFSQPKSSTFKPKNTNIQVTIDERIKVEDIGPHSSVKVLLRVFYTTCNYLFNGLVNSKQAKKTTEEVLGSSFKNKNVDSSDEIRDSFMWNLFCPSSSGFNLFSNSNIDLSGRMSNASAPNLDIFDMANIKISMINAFDNVNDIKNRLGIPFVNSGPFSELYNIVTKFIDKTGLVALMLNKNFQPIDMLITRPNYLKALRNDSKTGNIKMKDDVVLFLQHIKLELLKFCQKYHMNNTTQIVTAEERKQSNHIDLVIKRSLLQLQESQEMKSDKDKLIFEISSVLMPEGTDSKKMFTEHDFSDLIDDAEFKAQVGIFLTPYGELNPLYKEDEKEEEKAEEEVNDAVENTEKDAGKKETMETEKEPVEKETKEKSKVKKAIKNEKTK